MEYSVHGVGGGGGDVLCIKKSVNIAFMYVDCCISSLLHKRGEKLYFQHSALTRSGKPCHLTGWFCLFGRTNILPTTLIFSQSPLF